MTPRGPEISPLPSLRRAFGRTRRALVLRHALRATAAIALLLAAAVTSGLALPATPGAATARLAVFALGAVAVLRLSARPVAAESPRCNACLEAVEARFPR